MSDYLYETRQSKESLFVEDKEFQDEYSQDEEELVDPSRPFEKLRKKQNDKVDQTEGEIKENKTTRRKKKDEEEDNSDDQKPDEESEDADLEQINEFNNVDESQYKSNIRKPKELRVLDKNYELEYQLYYTKIKSEVSFIKQVLDANQSGDDLRIAKMKLDFYTKFFQIKSMNDLDKICLEYIKALQFVMYYYFHGCPSWTWYYPYFMSPFLSDLVKMVADRASTLTNTFEASEPHDPFDQLAYIQPRASLGLLPKIYGEVLLSDPRTQSYYPESTDFEPFDGIHDYQWIAKLELFQDVKISDVLKTIDTSKLTPEEKRRNSRGKEEVFRYNRDQDYVKVISMLSGIPDFEERIVHEEVNFGEKYPFDPNYIDYEIKGIDLNDGYPSLTFIPNIEATLQNVNKKAKYKRLIILVQPDKFDKDRVKTGHQGYVFFDYPFKKVGFVNTIVEDDQRLTTGNMDSNLVEAIIDEKRLQRPHDIYKCVSNESTYKLFRDRGIDFNVKTDQEAFYELEKRRSAWRTAMDTKGKIIFEFEHVDELYPHGLLMPFKVEDYKKFKKQFKFAIKESELFNPGTRFVSLHNGDIMKVSEKDQTTNTIFGDVTKPNNNSSKEVFDAYELLEDNWKTINESLLAELNLQKDEVLILYGLIDSFVIQTDSSKTSSLILGQMFDIGLRFIKALDQAEHKLMVVTDMVKIIRAKQETRTSFIVKKRGEFLFYDVQLSPKGFKVVKDYFKKFPELIVYMKQHISKWSKKFQLPRVHDVICLLT